MIFLKNFFKGVGLLINYNMARGLPGRSCLKSFNIIKKLHLPLPYLKKINKISYDRESLVTSLLVFFM